MEYNQTIKLFAHHLSLLSLHAIQVYFDIWEGVLHAHLSMWRFITIKGWVIAGLNLGKPRHFLLAPTIVGKLQLWKQWCNSWVVKRSSFTSFVVSRCSLLFLTFPAIEENSTISLNERKFPTLNLINIIAYSLKWKNHLTTIILLQIVEKVQW